MVHFHDQACRMIAHTHGVIIVIVYSYHIAVPVNPSSEELRVERYLGLPRILLVCLVAANRKVFIPGDV